MIKQRRIEEIVLKEFNVMNIATLQSALQDAGGS